MDMYALTDKMILSKIGESVRHLRLEQNISQKELAAIAGTSTSSVAAMERGESVSLKTLVPLLRALCTTYVIRLLERARNKPYSVCPTTRS